MENTKASLIEKYQQELDTLIRLQRETRLEEPSNLTIALISNQETIVKELAQQIENPFGEIEPVDLLMENKQQKLDIAEWRYSYEQQVEYASQLREEITRLKKQLEDK
jgi:hypothetical protein